MADVRVGMGLLHLEHGELGEAEAELREALGIARQIGYVRCIANVSANLGIVLLGREMYEEAKKMHKESLGVESQLNSLEGMARQYFNLGRVYEQMDDLEKARNMMLKSKKLYGEAGKGVTAEYVEKQIHQLKKT